MFFRSETFLLHFLNILNRKGLLSFFLSMLCFWVKSSQIWKSDFCYFHSIPLRGVRSKFFSVEHYFYFFNVFFAYINWKSVFLDGKWRLKDVNNVHLNRFSSFSLIFTLENDGNRVFSTFGIFYSKTTHSCKKWQALFGL